MSIQIQDSLKSHPQWVTLHVIRHTTNEYKNMIFRKKMNVDGPHLWLYQREKVIFLKNTGKKIDDL